MNEWQQEFRPTERDRRLHELAMRYHAECEAYDRTVCTGPILADGIMPATSEERRLINMNALSVQKRILAEAESEGINWRELADAIGKCHVTVPNV